MKKRWINISGKRDIGKTTEKRKTPPRRRFQRGKVKIKVDDWEKNVLLSKISGNEEGTRKMG